MTYNKIITIGMSSDNVHSNNTINSIHSVAINTIPSNIKVPSANYYVYVKWSNGYENWKLVRFSTPMDGSCLFHAITNAFFEPYHSEKLNGKKCSRKTIIRVLRKELAQRLGSPSNPQDPNSKTHYDLLNNGNTASFAEVVPEFTLDYMQREIDSDSSIGYGYLEFIANAINKDIYILEACRSDIYIMDNPELIIKGNRKSIVLYYINGHYELMGIQKEDSSFDTHFSPDHSFIRFLRNKILGCT